MDIESVVWPPWSVKGISFVVQAANTLQTNVISDKCLAKYKGSLKSLGTHMSRHCLQSLYGTLSSSLLTQFLQEPQMRLALFLTNLICTIQASWCNQLGAALQSSPPKSKLEHLPAQRKLYVLGSNLNTHQSCSKVAQHFPAGLQREAMPRQPLGMPHRNPALQRDQRRHQSQGHSARTDTSWVILQRWNAAYRRMLKVAFGRKNSLRTTGSSLRLSNTCAANKVQEKQSWSWTPKHPTYSIGLSLMATQLCAALSVHPLCACLAAKLSSTVLQAWLVVYASMTCGLLPMAANQKRVPKKTYW